jgi:hypothetical protein
VRGVSSPGARRRHLLLADAGASAREALRGFLLAFGRGFFSAVLPLVIVAGIGSGDAVAVRITAPGAAMALAAAASKIASRVGSGLSISDSFAARGEFIKVATVALT